MIGTILMNQPRMFNLQQIAYVIICSLFLVIVSEARATEIARVFEGPDKNAIYIRVKSNEFEIQKAGKGYVYKQKGEIRIKYVHKSTYVYW